MHSHFHNTLSKSNFAYFPLPSVGTTTPVLTHPLLMVARGGRRVICSLHFPGSLIGQTVQSSDRIGDGVGGRGDPLSTTATYLTRKRYWFLVPANGSLPTDTILVIDSIRSCSHNFMQYCFTWALPSSSFWENYEYCSLKYTRLNCPEFLLSLLVARFDSP